MTLATSSSTFVSSYVPGAALTAPTLGNIVIDAASEKAAFMGTVQKTGNITHICYRIGAFTSASTLDIRLETIDMTTGFPSGTLVGTNTNGPEVVAALGWKETALISPAAVTRGDFLASVIAQPAAAFGNCSVQTFTDGASVNSMAFPNVAQFTSSWAYLAGSAIMAFKYDDGTYSGFQYVLPINALVTQTANTGSTPDEIGMRFSYPFPATVTGAWMWCGTVAGADAEIVLYDSDGVTELAKTTLDADMRTGLGANIVWLLFPTPANISASAVYRLVARPTTANNFSLNGFSINSSDLLPATWAGTDTYATSAKDPTGVGDWTDTNTRQYFMGLTLNAFDNGAGGGGLVPSYTF